jgi:hypothetical protein
MDRELLIIIILLLLTVGVASLFSLTPLARALAKRLRGRHEPPADAGLREEVLGELQRVRGELAELAERMDFAERLLAKERESERLAPPGR